VFYSKKSRVREREGWIDHAIPAGSVETEYVGSDEAQADGNAQRGSAGGITAHGLIEGGCLKIKSIYATYSHRDRAVQVQIDVAAGLGWGFSARERKARLTHVVCGGCQT
jgi:hypothetical protein